MQDLCRTYTRDEVKKASLDYFCGDELSADTWTDKYAMRDAQDAFLELTPNDSDDRCAKEFARVESKYPNPMSCAEIRALFHRGKYVMLQGSPLAAIGNPYMIQSASNCMVIAGPEDSYGGIFRADEELAQLSKRRAGIGLDISNIRPKNVHVSNAARTTDGIGGYMERFSNTIREVGQSGRRGASLQSIDCRHPEIMTFIEVKGDRTKVTGSNISIKWRDDFLEAVEANAEYTLRWPVDVPIAEAKVVKRIKALEVWDAFIAAAHANAEPGALFWDTSMRESISDCYADVGFKTVSTNPCGEILLSPYDSCRLIVLNLMGYVKEPFTSEAHFDFTLFARHVQKAQRLMDDLVDLELEAIDRILAKVESDPEAASVKHVELTLWRKVRRACEAGRRTGLGITALGDCFAALSLVYGSDRSVQMTDLIYRELAVNAEISSAIMAGERGTFPVFDAQKEARNPYLARVMSASPAFEKLYQMYGRRNISLTTTAPVGTRSLHALVLDAGVNSIFQSTSGIEPVAVALATKRRKKGNRSDPNFRVDFTDQTGDCWQEYEIYHPGVRAWMQVTKETDVQKSPYYGATSNDVAWENGVDIQAAAQKWVSHSISKTANLPTDVTQSVVSQAYMRAWKSGLKGFTVYREGSRSGVILNAATLAHASEPNSRDAKFIAETHAPKRPESLPCDIHHVTVKGEKWVILVGQLNGKPYEVFGGLADKVELPKKMKVGTLRKLPRKKDGASVYDLTLNLEDDTLLIKNVVDQFDNPTHGAFTRALSLSVRHGIPVQYVVEQLLRDKHSDVTSFAAVLARVLKKYIPDGLEAGKSCPQCGTSPMVYSEGCMSCRSCGYSKC